MNRIPLTLAVSVLLGLAAGAVRAEVDWFEFKADYIAGSKDPNGQMRRGTEVMRLMAHDGKLYAALGIFMQNYSDGPLTGAQILRKDKPDGPWFVEKTFGPDYLRVDNFCEATFTQDKDGKKLSSPVTLFVAGLYAVWKRNTGHTSPAAVAVYNNKPGDWTTVKIAAPPMGPSNPMFASTAYMRVYEDTVTKRQYLLVFTYWGAVYKMAYDPAAPGKLVVVGGNEMEPFDPGRSLSSCIVDGVLYSAWGYSNRGDNDQDGGLYRRVDGEKPRWEKKYDWYRGEPAPYEKIMRGLTTLTNTASGETEILCAIEDPPAPVVRRLRPRDKFSVVDEINYRDFFTGIFGAAPNSRSMNAAAINGFEPVTIPGTTNTARLVTTYTIHPKSPAAGYNGAYYLIRFDDATYDWGKVADPNHLKDGVELHGIRTVAPSPWEKGVYYFGGYAAQEKNKSDTAWIYEARVKPGVVAKTSGTRPEPAKPAAKAELPQPATAPRRGGNIETIFRQLDRNGDGKLDASEAGDRPFFKPADKNGDGVLTLDEVKAYFGSRSSGRSPAASKPQPTAKP